MPLEDIDPGPLSDLPSEREQAILDDATARTDSLIASGAPPAFIPCDAREVSAVLRAIHDESLAPGDRFCEWGAGLGAVASLAAVIGFESYAVEIDPVLVEESRAFTELHDVDVEVLQGSFVPVDAQHLVDLPGDEHAFTRGGTDALDEEGLAIDDFAVIFAFPWPGEEAIFENLFEDRAAIGALLVTYHGLEGVRVRRKT